MRTIILLCFLALSLFGCTKTKTNTVTQIIHDTTPTPSVKTLDAFIYDSVYFDAPQNINYTLRPENAQNMNIILCSKNAVVNTEVNIYCFIYAGSKINIYPYGIGMAFPIEKDINPGSLVWYFNVKYMGDFNGEKIFNVITKTY